MNKKTLTALSAICLLGLTACGSNTQAQTSSSSSASASSSSSASASQQPLEVKEAWVKANSGDMTGAFATVTNTSDQAITIEGAQNQYSQMLELHTTELDPETGASSMKKVEGGFELAPGQTLELAPGGDHIMFMDMTCSLPAGGNTQITLKTSQGEVSYEAEIRDYSGAQEEYAPGEEHASHSAEASEGDHSGHANHGQESASALPACF